MTPDNEQAAGAAPQHWRRELHAFADRVLRSFAERDDVRGVALGGSLARGLEWLHADDDPAWRAAHADLCRFVGLDRPDAAATADLLARAQAYRTRLAE